MTNKEIRETDVYKKALSVCARNLHGQYAYQVIRGSLVSLEKALGKKAVNLLARDIPKIKEIVVIPE